MHITISGKNIDVGDALRQRVEARINEIVQKYLDRVVEVSVVISKDAHQFAVDIALNTGTHSHIVVKASAHAGDAYAGFDLAAAKVEKQLSRYKRKLKSHTDARKAREDSRSFVKYVLSGTTEDVPVDDHHPLVIAEQDYMMDHLSVSEAVMRLDLEDLPAVVFFNAVHGGVNVVYRRPDGNIAWLDPQVENKGLKKAG